MGKTNVYVEVAASTIPGVIAIISNRSVLSFIVVAAVFAVGLLVRSRDKDVKQLENHDSPYHAVWHIITAIGYYLAFYLDI